MYFLASGMRHLREQGFVHRDIKPGNIMRSIKPDGRYSSYTHTHTMYAHYMLLIVILRVVMYLNWLILVLQDNWAQMNTLLLFMEQKNIW